MNARGCGPVDLDGDFGKQTEAAVNLFQARFPDTDGLPLVVDGKIGSIAWAALFGGETVPTADKPAAGLLTKALKVAKTQLGVMEQPPGSNRGLEVDEYIRRVGLNPKDRLPWCGPLSISASTSPPARWADRTR